MKQFDVWNEVKKKTQNDELYRGFKEREIFHAKIGENIGYEQSGKGDKFLRPVLVFKKFNQKEGLIRRRV